LKDKKTFLLAREKRKHYSKFSYFNGEIARRMKHGNAHTSLSQWELSIMTEPTLARILRLSQQISYQYKNSSELISKSWLELESAQGNLRCLEMLYSEWVEEKGLEQERITEQ
jgi:hypothetical protein